MSTRLAIAAEDLPAVTLFETYADGTVWIVWDQGRRRARLREYAELHDQRCRGKGTGRGDECGTFPGERCQGQGNAMCVGRPGAVVDRFLA